MTTLLQIFIAILLVLILLFIALFIYNRDAIAQAKKLMQGKTAKQEVQIVNGFYDANSISNQIFKDIPFSVNQTGGAEMTYGFWIWKDEEGNVYQHTGASAGQLEYDDMITTGTDPKNKTFGRVNENITCDAGLHQRDIVLMLKGDPTVYEYGSLCYNDMTKESKVLKKDIMIKAPLIKFDRSTDRLSVEFNTYDGPDAVQSDSMEGMCTANMEGTWGSKTRYKFTILNLNKPNYIKKWFHVVVVIRDSNATGLYPLRNRISVKIFVNGELKLDSYADGRLSNPFDNFSLIRQNRFPLHVLPTIADGTTTTWTPNHPNRLLLGGIKYFNYALTDEDVSILFRTKFSLSVSTGMDRPINLDFSGTSMNDAMGTSVSLVK